MTTEFPEGGRPLSRGEADLLVREFLGAPTPRRNPRSVTAVQRVGARRFHLKRGGAPLRQEAVALEEAAGIGEVEGVRAIEKILFDEANNVLVTRFEEGESLFNRVWNSTALFRVGFCEGDLMNLLCRPARWLGVFHRSSNEGFSSAVSKERLAAWRWVRESLKAKLRAISECRHGLIREEGAKRIMAYVEGVGQKARDSGEVGVIHGDFNLVNQLVTRDLAIRILDFGDSRVGFVLEDLVRYWTAIWEIARCGRARGRQLLPVLPEILEVYGGRREVGVADSALFRTLRIWNAVTRVCELCESSRRYGSSTRFIHSRLARVHYRWLAEEVLGR